MNRLKDKYLSMGFFEWFSKPLQEQYADFTGRASRQAYWMFILVYFIIVVAIAIVEQIVLGSTIPSSVFVLAILIPSLSIATRRLHDIGMSGWWQLIQLIPILGWIVIIILLAKKGETVENEFGLPTNMSDIPTAPVDTPPAVEQQ